MQLVYTMTSAVAWRPGKEAQPLPGKKIVF